MVSLVLTVLSPYPLPMVLPNTLQKGHGEEG